MYRTVIDINREVPKDVLKRLAEIAAQAFNNRAGEVKNMSTSPYRFVYEDGKREYGCLNLGMLSLCDTKDFISRVLNREWIDEDEPNESCDVLKELSIPMR